MTLTEQWKKGELKAGMYYIKFKGSGKLDWWHGWYWEDSWSENVEEVLAPVPTYDEWQQLKEDYVDKHDKYLILSTTNHQLRKIIEDFNALDVAKENQQLKEMLYKCREKLDWLNGGYDVWGGELTDFIEEIDNVLGEKK